MTPTIPSDSSVPTFRGAGTEAPAGIGTTVRHLSGFVGVVVPGSPKLPDSEVNVMHLDGSVQTVELAHLTVLFDPRADHV